MSLNCNCNCRNYCPILAVLAAIILGIVAAFLQITGAITVTPAFLWVVLGIAVVYLGVLIVSSTRCCADNHRSCLCDSLGALLAGILGSALFSVVLLAVGVVATSIVSAILVGLLVGFFFLTLTASACLVRCLLGCES